MTDYELKLLKAFPKSFINHLGEFIGSLKENPYFCLADCKNELDVKCKVLEWFSRPACKTQYYKTTKRNEEYHKYMLDGINRFLETDFSLEDMEIIYEKLGNEINHGLTLKFIESGYDLKVLQNKKLYTWEYDKNQTVWNNGTFDSIKECIKDAVENGELTVGDTIAIGEVEPYELGSIDLVDNVLDSVTQDVYDSIGEAAEDYDADGSKEYPNETEQLNEGIYNLVLEYLRKTDNIPDYYSIKNIRTVKITERDL